MHYVQVPSFLFFLIFMIVALFVGILVGRDWTKEIYVPKVNRLKDEVNFYRSKNIYKYPGKGNW